jgi:hypothetical protein
MPEVAEVQLGKRAAAQGKKTYKDTDLRNRQIASSSSSDSDASSAASGAEDDDEDGDSPSGTQSK